MKQQNKSIEEKHTKECKQKQFDLINNGSSYHLRPETCICDEIIRKHYNKTGCDGKKNVCSECPSR